MNYTKAQRHLCCNKEHKSQQGALLPKRHCQLQSWQQNCNPEWTSVGATIFIFAVCSMIYSRGVEQRLAIVDLITILR